MEDVPPRLLNHIWNCNQYHLTRRIYCTPYPNAGADEGPPPATWDRPLIHKVVNLISA